MLRTLLTLVALCSQALSLLGPGVIVCRDRMGRVCLEFVGQSCTCCGDDTPVRTAPPSATAGCGCCRHHDELAEAPASAARPCDCEHVPLVADGADRPCVLPAPAAVDPLAALAPLWAVFTLPSLPDAGHRGGHHDPPGSASARSAHLPLLAAVVLRC